ncbi:MAG: hypothetical protein PHQ27_10165, partial [Victivallales bacterium]|nr:hypothetical protein [Victivallales bacterium]
MKRLWLGLALAGCVALAGLFPHVAAAEGYKDWGVGVPLSISRGYVAADDGHGRDVVLVWLMDHRGGYGVLQINALTGESAFVPVPAGGDCPYSSLLAKNNRFYTQHGKLFLEYDPSVQKFTGVYHTANSQLTMAMYQDRNGVIWMASYPNCELTSFDPGKRIFTEYGPLNRESWQQYPERMTGADDGWIYIGVGSSRGQIVGFYPPERKIVKLIPEDKRRNPSMGEVCRYADGKVRGRLTDRGNRDPKKDTFGDWYLLEGGKAAVCLAPEAAPVPVNITGNAWLRHKDFPSGRKLTDISLTQRYLCYTDAEHPEPVKVTFDYPSEGSLLLGLVDAPDGTIVGASMFPHCNFILDPRTGRIEHGTTIIPQWNVLLRSGDNIFIGTYTHGGIYNYRCGEPLTWKQDRNANPHFFGFCNQEINRPAALAITPNRKTLLMGGTPEYGCTGGGLAIADLPSGKIEVVPSSQLAPNESISALAPLDDRLILLGTTVEAGSGGKVVAENCSLLIYDLSQRKVIWRGKPFPK